MKRTLDEKLDSLIERIDRLLEREVPPEPVPTFDASDRSFEEILKFYRRRSPLEGKRMADAAAKNRARKED